MRRVTRAICSLREVYVQWPRAAAKDEVQAHFGLLGFPGAIGAIDGSLIRLVQVPGETKSAYYCRKKFYGVCKLSTVVFDKDVLLIPYQA